MPYLLPPAQESVPVQEHIPFNQKEICEQVRKYDFIYKNLNHIYQSYHGLCELICNYIIIKDLLDKNCTSDRLKKINVVKLEKQKITSSHILNASSSFSMFKAYLFNIYPYDLFSHSEIESNNQIDEKLLSSKLDNVNNNAYIKFFVFSKSIFSFKGHSMLIKKTGNDFTFFDPNQGVFTHLSVAELCKKLSQAYEKHKGTNMAFIDGNKYIDSLQPDESKQQSRLGRYLMVQP
ncbi:hypothetical protein [Legionella gratiana]|nr:hypothetical protein [Legionella gratiana]